MWKIYFIFKTVWVSRGNPLQMMHLCSDLSVLSILPPRSLTSLSSSHTLISCHLLSHRGLSSSIVLLHQLTFNSKLHLLNSFQSNLRPSWPHAKLLRFFFHKPSITFCIRVSLSFIFSHPETRSPGTKQFALYPLNKDISIFYIFSHWQCISYLLYTLKSFLYYF